MTTDHLESDLGQVKLAISAITAAFVKTLNKSDPTFQEKFERHLEEWYLAIRDRGKPDIHALETLRWVRSAARATDPYDALPKEFGAVIPFKKP